MESTAPGDHPGTVPLPTRPRVGPYLLGRRLGAGGMGAVFEGVHERTGARRAVKTILVRPDERPEDLARFRREAALTSRLAHPNIVRIHEVGLDRPPFFIAMDLVEGGSLQARLDREGPLPVAQAVEVAVKLADALAHAHAHGVVHRDVKPLNVIIDAAGEPRLLDFGLARASGALAERLTLTGEVLGTPRYIAPEQAADARSVDGRADVYGLGGILYAMLTGQPPVPGQHLTEVLINVQTHVPPPPSSLRPEVPPALDAVCARALAKEPDARFASALDLLEALRAAAGGAGPRRRRAGRRGRRLALAALGVGAVLAVAAAGLALTTSRPDAPAAAADAGASEEPTAAGGVREEVAPPAPDRPRRWSIDGLERGHHLLSLTLTPPGGAAAASLGLLLRSEPGDAGVTRVLIERVTAWAGGDTVARFDVTTRGAHGRDLHAALGRLPGGAAAYRFTTGAVVVTHDDLDLAAALVALHEVGGEVALDRALAMATAALLEPAGWSAALTQACQADRGADGAAVVELEPPGGRHRVVLRQEPVEVHVAREEGLAAVRAALARPPGSRPPYRGWDAATLWLTNGLGSLEAVRPGDALLVPRPARFSADGALAAVTADLLPLHAAPDGPVVATLRRGALVGAHRRERGAAGAGWRQACVEGAEVWVEAASLGPPPPGLHVARIRPAGPSDWAVAHPDRQRKDPSLGFAPDGAVFVVHEQTVQRYRTAYGTGHYFRISYAGRPCWILEIDTQRVQ
ncbi:MAG: serine/threonine protein kinase [Planctomycetes bacterium]|nr:serine/threonine protein kinase [Planctomycetota bacterium]